MGVSRVATVEGMGLDPGQTLSRVSVAQGVAGTTVLKVAQLGKRHKIVQALLTLSADGTVKFQSGTNDLTGPMDVGAKGGFVYESDSPLLCANPNEDLNLVTTGGAANGAVLILSE